MDGYINSKFLQYLYTYNDAMAKKASQQPRSNIVFQCVVSHTRCVVSHTRRVSLHLLCTCTPSVSWVSIITKKIGTLNISFILENYFITIKMYEEIILSLISQVQRRLIYKSLMLRVPIFLLIVDTRCASLAWVSFLEGKMRIF